MLKTDEHFINQFSKALQINKHTNSAEDMALLMLTISKQERNNDLSIAEGWHLFFFVANRMIRYSQAMPFQHTITIWKQAPPKLYAELIRLC